MKRSTPGFRRSERLEAQRLGKKQHTESNPTPVTRKEPIAVPKKRKTSGPIIPITETDEETPIDFGFILPPTQIVQTNEDMPIDFSAYGVPYDLEPTGDMATDDGEDFAKEVPEEVIETEPLPQEENPIEIVYIFFGLEERVFFNHKPSLLNARLNVDLLQALSLLQPIGEEIKYDKNVYQFVHLSYQILDMINDKERSLDAMDINDWITNIIEVFDNKLEYFPILYWMITDLFKAWNFSIGDDHEGRITVLQKFQLIPLFFRRLDTKTKHSLLSLKCNMVSNVIYGGVAEEMIYAGEFKKPILKITNDFMMNYALPLTHLEEFINYIQDYIPQHVDHPMEVAYSPYTPPGT